MNKTSPRYDAKKYASTRPSYPAELYQTLFGACQQFNIAWDCGCGNGQASTALAEKFKQVIATDIASNQIEQAAQRENISYLVENSANTSIKENSIDLITIAQALHWFDHAAFAKEVDRVLKPQGVVAAWGYSLPKINPALDALLKDFAGNILKDYWAPGREYLDNEYANIPFPVPVQLRKTFTAGHLCGFEHLISFLQSWSPRLKYLQQHGTDIVEKHREEFVTAWGDTNIEQNVEWPFHLVLGIKN
jgi:SAM-dependent methyltransferase